MERTILHCDMNNFFASVECILNPAISKYPVAVSGNPRLRKGIILAKNYLAKAYKIKTGEAIWEAKQKCPTLICVSPHYNEYEKYSKLATEIYAKYTDKIEPFGMDEVWLDVTESLTLFKDANNIAKNIQSEIKKQLGLSISIGISWSKTLAKLGSDMRKPMGLVEINHQNHQEILSRMKLSDFLMIGKRTLIELNKLNIFSLTDLMNYDPKLLHAKFGVAGTKLYNSVWGIDDDTVTPYDPHDIKSVGNGVTAPHDLTNLQEVEQYVSHLSDLVATRLRSHNYKANTVHLSIKFADFTYKGAQKTLLLSIDERENIAKYAMQIFMQLTNGSFEPIRALRVKCSGLNNDTHYQLNFFDKKQNILGTKIDEIRSKYGDDSLFLLSDN